MSQTYKKPKTIPQFAKFIIGGSAGMTASVFVQPLDLVKNRMQLQTKEHATTFQVIKNIYNKEGFFGFYNGLSAGLLRQATYTTGRLGVYTWLFEAMSTPNNPPNFLTKAAIAMAAGAFGSFIGTPAEIALIRMTSDGRLPKAERRNYKSVFDAIFRIIKEEGVLTLWRGALPTMGRAVVVNAAQLASYSQIKELILDSGYLKDGIGCHFVASMCSGLITTAASMPVDILKTRIQSMKTINGKPEYSGAIDVLVKIIKNEGVFALWKGFTPYYARLGPHTVLTFIFLEQYNNLYKKYITGGDDDKPASSK